jgi:ariadne-1
MCAAPWKTCNCPWFTYPHLDEDDRLTEMRVPYIPDPENGIHVTDEPVSAPPPVRRSSTRVRPRNDRGLGHSNEGLSARLQAQMRLDPTPTSSERDRAGATVHVYGLGNSGSHHMNESYTVRPLATSAARTAVRRSDPLRLFSRRTVRESLRPPPRPTGPAKASTMAGLSRDGNRRGMGRVGTWLQHVERDDDAIEGRTPREVEVDDWRSCGGSLIGVD